MEEEREITEAEKKMCIIQTEWRKTWQVHRWNSPQNHTEPENVFLFYWFNLIDYIPAREVSLIGKKFNQKTKLFESCCVTIKKVHKTFYLLPNYLDGSKTEQVALKEAYDKFKDSYATPFGIKKFEAKVVKKRALDKDVPFETNYFEITCNTDDNKIINVQDGQKILNVLGAKLGFVQTFLMQRGLKGPGWLEIRNTVKKPQLHMKFSIEIATEGINNVIPVNSNYIPPFRILIFNVKTLLNPSKNKREITMICWIFCDQYDVATQCFNIKQHFCVLNTTFGLPHNFKESISNYTDTKIKMACTEKECLKLFLEAFEEYEVDLVVSYDLTGEDLNLLFEKIIDHKLKQSYLSCRKYKHNLNDKYKTDLFCGKLLFNLKSLAENLFKSTSYTLEELIIDVLKVPYVKIDDYFVKDSFGTCPKLRQLITLTMWETYCIFDLVIKFKMIPFTLELTKLCGNHWSMTLEGTVTGLCEYLILHALHAENYIIPDELENNKENRETIQGGLVLEPKLGLHHEHVVAMDFCSLYPSIIQEYNLCFSTYFKHGMSGEYIHVDNRGIGVLPQLVGKLLALRKLKKNDDTQQLVIKKITNSLYGYLSYENSKFYSPGIAKFITKSGREILTKTVNLVQGLGYEVIYGDTDSVMFKINSCYMEKVVEEAEKIKKIINKDYKHVNIEISSIFRRFLVYNKKKYAAIEYVKDQQRTFRYVYKGMELVRRDVPKIVKKIQEVLLMEILNMSSPQVKLDKAEHNWKIVSILKDFERDLRANRFEMEDFAIMKKLNYDLESYKEKSQPHIDIARREFGQQKDFQKNSFIRYIFGKDGENKNSYHIEEAKEKSISVDIDHYLENQIFPLVSRTLEEFGISTNEIRKCLNLKIKDIAIVSQYNPHYEIFCVFCSKRYKSQILNLKFLEGCGNCPGGQIENKVDQLTLMIDLLSKNTGDNNNRYKELVNILKRMVRTFKENKEIDLGEIAKKSLTAIELDFKINQIKNPVKTKTLYYEIPCVICHKWFKFKENDLSFLGPCEKCTGKKLTDQYYHISVLLTLLMAQFNKVCTNPECGEIVEYSRLKQNLKGKSQDCEVCKRGTLERKFKWGDLYKTIEHIWTVLEKNKMDEMAKMVKEIFEQSGLYTVNLSDIFSTVYI